MADWLQCGVKHFAGFWMSTAWRGQAIDNLINLTQILLDSLDGQSFDLIGESIAIDAFRIQAFLLSKLVESCAVLPAGGSRFTFFSWAFKENTQRIGTTTKCCCDSSGQPVSS